MTDYNLRGLPADLVRGESATGRELRVAIASAGRAVQVDFTGAMVTMDHGHSMIHRGASLNVTTLVDLPASGTIWLTWQGGVHWTGGTFNASEGGFQVELREGVVGTGGTALPPINRNRRPPIPVSALVVNQGVTVTDEGVRLATFGFPPAATQQARVAVSGADNREWVADGSLLYGLKIQNNTNAAKELRLDLDWYEPGLL